MEEFSGWGRVSRQALTGAAAYRRRCADSYGIFCKRVRIEYPQRGRTRASNPTCVSVSVSVSVCVCV